MAMHELPILSGVTPQQDWLTSLSTTEVPAQATRAPLPMSAEEMRQRGWDEVDVVFVTGDAYIDHPSFAMAILGRVLEAAGFRVGILAQPDWHSCHDWRRFGRPRLFFAISAGNMDSMINHYTANRKVRNDDAYSPGGRIGRRPDRAVGQRAGALGPWGRRTERGRQPMSADERRGAHDPEPADAATAASPVTAAAEAPVGREPEDGVALCLSGGGYRAMLFHLGALWRLNEAGFLPRLARVSSVSGGSITAGLLTLRVGVSLSVPPAPVPSSRIVPTPVSSEMIAFTAPLSTTKKLSLFSNTASSRIDTVIVWLVTPAAKFSVPVAPVKSAPLTAVPLPVA